jgi:hypothetical protein
MAHERRSALVLDLMEPLRPLLDRLGDWAAPGSTAFADRFHPERGLSRAPTMIQEIGFALDSPLEQRRFELSVPP